MPGKRTLVERAKVASIVFPDRPGPGRQEYLCTLLEDGRLIAVPLDIYPALKAADLTTRRNWRLVGRGQGVHWPDLDLDLSAEGLVAARPDMSAGARSRVSAESLPVYLLNAFASAPTSLAVADLATILSRSMSGAKLRSVLSRAIKSARGGSVPARKRA